MIYADYNGTSPLLPSVKDYLHKRIDTDLFANPNAIHSKGQKIYQGIEKCRKLISSAMGCEPDQLIFNSGASEGISQILHSVLEWGHPDKKIIITSPIEHAVMGSALNFYQDRRAFKILRVDVSADGIIDFDHFKELVKNHKEKIALVTIMAANNETGVIQPFHEIAEICKQEGIVYFSDTTQLIGKSHFNFNQSGIDYAVCSGHKLGAFTGTGFVIAKDPLKLKPYIYGSHQEKGLRGGTQNYLGIETLAIAVDDFIQNIQLLKQLEFAKLNFEAEIKKEFPKIVILGINAQRLAGTTLISYPGIHGQGVQIELEANDIFVTTSAACSDNQPETSTVLKSMGIGDEIGRGVVRISLSYSHGQKEYSILAQSLKSIYNKLSKIQSY